MRPRPTPDKKHRGVDRKFMGRKELQTGCVNPPKRTRHDLPEQVIVIQERINDGVFRTVVTDDDDYAWACTLPSTERQAARTLFEGLRDGITSAELAKMGFERID